MARLKSFEAQVVLATAGLAANAIAPALAAFARSELAKVISSGEGSPDYDRYVNGNLGASESTVVPPGPIIYDFIWWEEVVRFALQSAVERSPRKSGRYRQSWYILVNGNVVTDFKSIRRDATVHIVNTQPYHRKIEVGHMHLAAPAGVVEATKSAVNGIFGNLVLAKNTMLTLSGGPSPAPYTLKGHFKRGVRKNARTKLRADTKAGAAMTYPALALTMRH